MKQRILLGALIALLSGAGASFAGERTVTLAVENMYCAACPLIVKESIAVVPGVSKVEVSYKAKTAVVTFDDVRTNLDSIAAASAKAGYPARPAN